MSKKSNKISVNKLESTMQNNVVSIPMAGYEDIEIVVRRVLPLRDVMQFVEDVVSSCVDRDTGSYIPEVQAFATRACVLTQYANFTLPKDSEKQYDLVYNTSAFHQVMDVIDRAQYDEILYSINERIKHEVAMMESSMAAQIADITAKLDHFVETSEAMFGSVSDKDMSALIHGLANGGRLDEKKIVDAVMDARRQENAAEHEDPVVSSDGEVITFRKKKG